MLDLFHTHSRGTNTHPPEAQLEPVPSLPPRQGRRASDMFAEGWDWRRVIPVLWGQWVSEDVESNEWTQGALDRYRRHSIHRLQSSRGTRGKSPKEEGEQLARPWANPRSISEDTRPQGAERAFVPSRHKRGPPGMRLPR